MFSKNISLLCGAFLVLGTAPSPAQAAQEVQTLVVGDAKPTMLIRGTPVSLRLLRELTTKGKMLRVGDRFDMETVDPLKLGTATIIPAGTRAVGEITFVKNKGSWGKSGRFQARAMYLQLPDRTIRLQGEFNDKGKSGGWGAGLTTAFIFAPAGFFMTGTSARLEAGTIVQSVLDEDVKVIVSADTSKPLVPQQ